MCGQLQEGHSFQPEGAKRAKAPSETCWRLQVGGGDDEVPEAPGARSGSTSPRGDLSVICPPPRLPGEDMDTEAQRTEVTDPSHTRRYLQPDKNPGLLTGGGQPPAALKGGPGSKAVWLS